MTQVSIEVVNKALIASGMSKKDLKEMGDIEERQDQLRALAEDEEEVADCDTCHEEFPFAATDAIDVCPYCGAAGDGEEEEEEEEAEEAEEEDEVQARTTKRAGKTKTRKAKTAPPKGKGKTKVRTAKAKANGKSKGKAMTKAKAAKSKVSKFTREDYEETVAVLLSVRNTYSEASWELATKLKETYDSEIWRTQGGTSGGGFKSFESFCEDEIHLGSAYVKVLVKCAELYDAEQFNALGIARARLLNPLPTKTRDRLAKKAIDGDMSSREVQKAASKELAKVRERDGKKADGRKGKAGRPKTRLFLKELVGEAWQGATEDGVDGDVFFPLGAGFEAVVSVKTLKSKTKIELSFQAESEETEEEEE